MPAIKITDNRLSTFYNLNPDFDILHFNLSDQAEVSTLNWQGLARLIIVELLKKYQRLLRLNPDPEVAMTLLSTEPESRLTQALANSSTDDKQDGSRLDTAQAIAAMPEAQFVKDFGPKVGEATAKDIHQNARAVTAKTMLLWANIHNGMAPYSRAMRVNNVGDALQHFENFPDYQELFGTLNFCECDECRSIFGAAAYFVDLMRIIDQYITTPNQGHIDKLFQLNERRPDLALIPLTCENTNGLVPYLSIVNDILAVRTAHFVPDEKADELSQNEAIDAAYKALACATYPFNLPFNLPLEQIGSYLGQLNTDLATHHQAFNAAFQVVAQKVPVSSSKGSKTMSKELMERQLVVAREVLGLSLEEYTLIITSRPNAADLTAVYGVTVTSDSDLGGLDNQDTFRKQTGLSRQELENLLTQNLSQDELNAGLAHAFYFNQILDKDHPLQLGTDKSTITNLNMAALDRLQRFIRLAKKLNWSFADLDWVLRSLHASEITAEAIQSLATIKQVQARVHVPAVMLSSLWYDLKTIGVGTSKASQAPFDIIFNNPQWLGRQPTYHPGNPIPMDAAHTTPYELNLLYKDNVLSTPAASRFAVALGMSLDNFATLAAIVDPNLKLTVPVCSLLYRHTLLASLVKLPLEQYLLLLQLTNKQQTLQMAEGLQPKAFFTLEDLQYLLDSADWLRSSGLTVYDLTYVLKGTMSRYVTGKYKEENISSFLQSLQALAIPAQPALAASDILDWTDLLKTLNSPLPPLQKTIWNVLKPDIQELIQGLVEKATDPQSQHVANITPTQDEQTTLVGVLNGVVQGAKDSWKDPNIPAAVTVLLQSGTILSENETKKLNRLVLEAAFPQAIAKSTIRQIGDEWKEKLNQQLATFVGSTPEMVTAFMEILGPLLLPPGAETHSYIEAFYQQDIKDCSNRDTAPPCYVQQVLDALSRGLVLAEKLQLKSAEIDSVRIAPASYGFPPHFQAITIDNLKSLFVFKQLTAAFQDTQNQLCTYLATASDKAPPSLLEALAIITGWGEQQINAVCEEIREEIKDVLKEDSPQDSDPSWSSFLTSLGGLTVLKTVFDLNTSMGVDFSWYVQIVKPLATLSVQDDNNHKWSVYTSAAQTVINTVKTRYNDDDWAKISTDIESRLSEMKRDALTGFVLWKLGQEDSSIKNLRNLSEYLLIDVEMTGCASISPIKQGLLSLQMYLQRCRMNLEPGATTTHIHEVWWEWMMNYRIWEANRKVFLYPENYIDPSLRKSKSDLFSELESELLQSDITQEAVEAAYKNYFDKFAELANLRVAASYRCFVKQPGSTDLVDTLFLFGRTATEPPTYYSRECINPTAPHPTWTPWSKIDININSDYIAPVFAFHKLFVFWVESKETTDSSTSSGTTTKTTVKKATIKYTFQTLGGNWVQPQTLVKDRVINVSPCEYRPSNIDFNTEDLVWKKVYPLVMPETGTQPEKVLITFGDLPRIPTAEPEPPQPGTSEATNIAIALFENQIYKALQQAYRVTQDHYQGYFTLLPTTTLTGDLSTEERFLTLPMKLIKTSINNKNLQARSAFATTVVGNLAFFAGGAVQFDPRMIESDMVDIFDAETWQWITAQDGQPFKLSQARVDLATTVVGNLAFFAGGYASSGCSPVVDIFDAETRQWIKDKNGQPFTLSQPRYSVNAVTVGKLAIFAGGLYDKDNARYYSTVVDIFDAETQQWITDKINPPFTLSQARSFFAATVVKKFAIFAGGKFDGAPHMVDSDVVDVFDAETRQRIDQTFTLSPARGNVVTTTVGNLAIFAGANAGFGADSLQVSKAVNIFDAEQQQWITDNGQPFTLSQARQDMAVTTVGKLVIFAGGSIPGVSSWVGSDVVDIFDAETRQWIKDKNGQPFTLSQPRGEIAATTVGNLAIFAGGSGSDVVDIFDAETRQWSTNKLSHVNWNPTAVTVGNLAIVAQSLGTTTDIDVFALPSARVGVVDRATFKVIPLDNVLLANAISTPRPYVDNVLLASTTSAPRPYIPRPYAYWPLDEGTGTTIRDEAGSNDGTLQGTLSQKWESFSDFSGTSSRSVLQFRDPGNYVSLPPKSIPSGQEITVSFWAYGGTSLPKQTSVIEAMDGNGKRMLNIHLPWEDSKIYFHCGTTDDNGQLDQIVQSAPPAPPADYQGHWAHWAFTKNAAHGAMKIYLNGVLWYSETGHMQSLPLATMVTLGCGCTSNSNQYREYDGKIADLHIWNVALSDEQIALIASPSSFSPQLEKISRSTSSALSVTNQPGWFTFDNGDEAFLVIPQQAGLLPISDSLTVHDDERGAVELSYSGVSSLPKLKFAFTRLTTSTIRQLSQKAFMGGIDHLLTLDAQLLPELDFTRLDPASSVIAPASSVLDFDGPYGLYFQEIFFHIPFLVANTLASNQRFAEAQKWYHYIFNPTQPSQLTGYWPLDEQSGTTDKTGNNDGTAMTAPLDWQTVSDFPGAVSRSVLQFSGKGGTVSLPSASIPQGQEITISFWAFGGQSSPTKAYSIITAERTENGNKRNVLSIDLSGTEGKVHFDCGLDRSNYDEIFYPAPQNVYQGIWSHWTFTKDACRGEMNIYLNGKLLHSEPGKTLPLPAATTVILGGNSDSTLTYDGKVAELRIWNVALSPEEVLGIANEQPADHFWRYLPFRGTTLEKLKDILANDDAIKAYTDDPFDPHAIAGLRVGTYQKTIVMKYIDNLLNWGDSLFAQDTWESITQATMLYFLAFDLLGPKPEDLGPSSTPAAKTFADIKNDYKSGDIPQFLLELELHVGNGNASSVVRPPFNEVNAYFCVSENDQFTAYWDKVEDRLYKIRHCQNIEGVVRQLALFEPPINPADLVRAVAAGNVPMSVVSGLTAEVPHYRFEYMLERAKNVTSTLIQLGSALLSALEKKDAEQLSFLRATQETAIAQMIKTTKQKQIEEAQAGLEALNKSLAAAQHRVDNYQDWIEAGLSAYEQGSQALQIAAVSYEALATLFNTLSSPAYFQPSIFGLADGGMNWGGGINALADGFAHISNTYNMGSSLAGTIAGYERRKQEWQLQLQMAQDDADLITQQIVASQVNVDIAQAELAIQQKSIEQANEVEDFLKRKFSNQDLYQWMVNRLSVLSFQTFKLALDMALAAQKAYQYELNSDDTFIQFDYWDSLKQGLLAGEGLLFGLNQLEKAYIEGNVRRLEIEKTISLLQLDPKAFLDLKHKGKCQFELSERLFDYDFPGHYCRQIKSISLSIPAVVGPYQNIKATLTQLRDRVLIKNDNDGKGIGYLLNGGDMPASSTLRSSWRRNQKIALSRGVNDNGMFELNFRDERYLPFEGTGAVSKWELSMPRATNHFDFESLSDVIIHLSYTALDGGESFAQTVQNNLNPYQGSYYLNLRQNYPGAWHAFLQTRQLKFNVSSQIIPPHIKEPYLKKIIFKLDVSGEASISGTSMSLQIGGNAKGSITFKDSYASLDFDSTCEQFVGDWVIELHSDKINNIELIVMYQGQIDWNS